jgi:hypothetical protein
MATSDPNYHVRPHLQHITLQLGLQTGDWGVPSSCHLIGLFKLKDEFTEGDGGALYMHEKKYQNPQKLFLKGGRGRGQLRKSKRGRI